MPGPPPKDESKRRRANEPAGGEWATADGIGWQYGDIPEPPKGLMPASVVAWETWFRAWFAAHWFPFDLPSLKVAIGLYDQVERGEFQRMPELRAWMNAYGITPKGQEVRRWKRPESAPTRDAPADRYGHLRLVDR